MAENLISRAGLARLAGCSRPAITKACRQRLAPACVAGRVDLAHPSAQAFLALHGVDRANVTSAVAADRKPAVLISPALLRLELRQVLALHASAYEPGEPVALGKLITACRRMVAQLHSNGVAARREQPTAGAPPA